MQLSNLKPAWEQLKLNNSLKPLESSEIMLLLETEGGTRRGKSLRMVLNIAMFVAILIVCQGG